MPAGKRNRLFTFQHNTGATRDATGGPVAVWTKFCTAYVQKVGAEAREVDAMRRKYADAQYGLVALWNSKTSTLTPLMRAIEGPIDSDGEPAGDAVVFDILGVIDPTGKRRAIQIAVKERDIG